MMNPRSCNGPYIVVYEKGQHKRAGVVLSSFSSKYASPVSRLYMYCCQAASVSKTERGPEIGTILNGIIDNAFEAGKAYRNGDTDTEREAVDRMLDGYRLAFAKFEEKGFDEPPLTSTFNYLIRRRNDLNPPTPDGPTGP